MTFCRALFDPDYARQLVAANGIEQGVSRGGRPSDGLGLDGYPAYESATGSLLLMECLGVFDGGPCNAPMLLPIRYGTACAIGPDGDLVALHHDPDAVWSWRPLLYTLTFDGDVQRLGSQHEQEYRVGVAEARAWSEEQLGKMGDFMQGLAERVEARHGQVIPMEEMDADEQAEYVGELRAFRAALKASPPELGCILARDRADALLRESLNPQQRLTLQRWGWFYVRGVVNRLYRVEVGNGASICDPATHEPLVTLCLHPDRYIPHADVALATKLLIDSGADGEEEMLEGATARPQRAAPPATAAQRHAWELERDLLPPPPS